MPPPGYVDLQVNGYLGINFTSDELTVGHVRRVVSALTEQGTAAFCPTIITAPPGVIAHSLRVLAEAHAEPDLKEHLLGIHLEGPFLDRDNCGCHPEDCLRSPDVELFKQWQETAHGHIRILTLAPELRGAATLIRAASDAGVLVSLGHHGAGVAEIRAAVDAGARFCTHLGNGIDRMVERHPNPLWTQLACDDLAATFITDGHHLPPEFIRVALRAKTVERFIVVSDSAAIAGLEPGPYHCSGCDVVLEESGRIVTKDGWKLAGSSSTIKACMTHLETFDILSAEELKKVGRTNALELLGIDD